MDNVFKQLTVMQDSTLILADTFGSNVYITESGHARFAESIQTVLVDTAALSDSLTLAVNSTPAIEITPPNVDFKNLNLININNLISQTQTITETIQCASNLLILDSGLQGQPPSTLISGIEVNRGSEVSYFFGLREADQSFVLGQYNIDSSTYQNILTRAPAPISNGLFYYNSSLYQASSDSSLTFDPIYKILSATTLNATSNIQLNNTTILSAGTLGATITASSLTSVGALSSGSIGGSFGTINIGSNSLTAGPIVCTTLNATQQYQLNGSTILSGSTLSSLITASSLQSVGALSSGSIASGFGSINIGSNSLTAGPTVCTTISGTSINLTTGGTYSINSTVVLSSSTLGSSILNSSLTSVGALNSGSISSGFGNINIGSSNSYSIGSSIVLSASTLGSSVLNSSLAAVGALSSGSIASGFGSINIGSNALTCGALICTSLNASSSIELNNTTILSSNVLGSTITASSLTSVGALASGSIVSGFGSINIGSNALTAGALTCTTISGTSINLAVGNVYSINSVSVLSSSTLGSSVLNSSLTSVGALNAGSITSGFGSISINSGATYSIGSNVVLSAGALGSSIVSSSLTSVGSLSSGSIVSGFGSINIGSNSLTCGTLNAVNPLQINGVQVLSSTALGGLVISSNLSQVGALTSGSIASGFGNINIGSNALSAGYLTLNPISNNVGLSITNVGNGNCLTIQNSGSLMAILDKNMNFSLSGNVSVATGSSFQINNVSVIYGNTLGSTITASSLTSVGALSSGSIGGSFGNINISSNTLTCGSVSASGSIAATYNVSAGGGVSGANGQFTNLSTSGLTISTAANVLATLINTGTYNCFTIQNAASSPTKLSYLDYNHNLTLAGTLNMSSNTVNCGPVNANGTVTGVNGSFGSMTLTSGLYVTGSSTFYSNISVSGSITIPSSYGNLNINNNALACGAITSTVSGSSVGLTIIQPGSGNFFLMENSATLSLLSTTLDYNHNLTIGNNITAGGNIACSSSAKTLNASNISPVGNSQLVITCPYAQNININSGKGTTSGDVSFNYQSTNSNVIINNGNLTLSNGNIGIANSSPSGYLDVQGSTSGSGPIYGTLLRTNLTETSSSSGTCGVYIGGTHTINGSGSNSVVMLQVHTTAVATSAINQLIGVDAYAPTVTGSALTSSCATMVVSGIGSAGAGGVTNAYGLCAYAPTAGTAINTAIYCDNISIGSNTTPPASGAVIGGSVTINTGTLYLGTTSSTNIIIKDYNTNFVVQSQAAYGYIQFNGQNNNASFFIKDIAHNTGAYISPNTNGWTNTSDSRLKTNLVPIDNCLAKLAQINGYYYSLISDMVDPPTSTNKYMGGACKRIGFIAQEVNVVFPEIIQQDTDGYYGVMYAEMTAVLTNAITELNTIVTAQAATIASQATAITSMQAAITALQASVAALQTK